MAIYQNKHIPTPPVPQPKTSISNEEIMKGIQEVKEGQAKIMELLEKLVGDQKPKAKRS